MAAIERKVDSVVPGEEHSFQQPVFSRQRGPSVFADLEPSLSGIMMYTDCGMCVLSRDGVDGTECTVLCRSGYYDREDDRDAFGIAGRRCHWHDSPIRLYLHCRGPASASLGGPLLPVQLKWRLQPAATASGAATGPGRATATERRRLSVAPGPSRWTSSRTRIGPPARAPPVAHTVTRSHTQCRATAASTDRTSPRGLRAALALGASGPSDYRIERTSLVQSPPGYGVASYFAVTVATTKK